LHCPLAGYAQGAVASSIYLSISRVGDGEWMGTILTRKPLCYKRFGACWERLGSLAGGEGGIATPFTETQ
jgi:hypothetical protein